MRLNRPDSVLYLMSPMASGPTPRALAARQRRAVHEQLHAFDARRRHGVDVGDDEQVLGECLVLVGDDAHAGGGGGEDHLGIGDDRALLLRRLARLGDEVDTEALLGHLGRLDDAVDAAMGDERDFGAFQRSDDRGGEADDAGGAEHGDLRAFPGRVLNLLRSTRSTQATIAAAVVNEPAGSANVERLERGHQRLLRGVHHVERQNGVLAADEEAGAHAIVRGAREDGVLRQRRSPLRASR